MMKQIKRVLLIGLFLLIAALIVIFAIPSLRERAINRLDGLKAQIKYMIDPPGEAVFTPGDQVAIAVQQTIMAYGATQTAAAMPTATPLSSTPQATSIPTITPTPLPAVVKLDGIRFQSQRGMWNYCAPANLAMALSYWGWEGDKLDVGKVVKPYSKDKNVMPYEMQIYAEENANLKAVVRVGGDLQTIKKFISAGYPVIVEKSEVLHGEYGAGSEGWMGHYMVFNGYDDSTQTLVGQDSLRGADQSVPYAGLEDDWRGFNYVYIVIYPPADESKIMDLLGDQADEKANYEYGALKASNEVMGLSDRDQFFAYYNRGTNLIALQDYGGAAAAYDAAFAVYVNIPVDDRPYRALWYQTGPYYAYYFTQRYWDVIDLATTTLDNMSEPILEESYYWRARAYYALGDVTNAEKDLRMALKYHAGFGPALDLLQQMGIEA